MTLAIIVTRIEELINKAIATTMASYAKTIDLFSRNHNDLTNKGIRTHLQIDTFIDSVQAGNATVSAHATSHAIAGLDPITPVSIGAADLVHSHPATAHSHSFPQITGFAADNPDLVAYVGGRIAASAGYGVHAANHAIGGLDPITPASIGALPSNYAPAWVAITGADPSANAVLDTYVKSLVTAGVAGNQIETVKVSGTMVQTSGLTHTVSALAYKILGVNYTSVGGSLTFDEITVNNILQLKRIDVVYADNAGLIHILKGTEAIYPIKPVVDNSYVEIASILIDSSNGMFSIAGKVYRITLPSDTTVQGRVNAAIAGIDYLTGWILVADSVSPTDLKINHGLNKNIVSATVFTVVGTVRRQLFASAAYSGIISADSNNLTIESLATIQTKIEIDLIFV